MQFQLIAQILQNGNMLPQLLQPANTEILRVGYRLYAENSMRPLGFNLFR